MQQPACSSQVDDSPTAMLFQRYAAPIFTALRRRVPSREDAEDLLLEVFLAAFEQEHYLLTLAEGARLAWLRRVAHYKLVDYYRRSNRRPAVPLGALEEALEEDERLGPEQVALQREEERRVAEVLPRLPALQQEVVRLRFAGGLRCAQIADVLGKREGAVRMALSRALNLLRTLYEER
jgi:RNA polymerase sigma-70 factor, ECF subfamily